MSATTMTSELPLPSSSSTQSTTTTAPTATTSKSQDEDGCVVYWDDHQPRHRLIEQVPPHPKRSSSLAGIPSPSKQASERDPKEPVHNLKLFSTHQNNSKALRLNKRRKNKAQTDEAEPIEPKPPLASPSTPQPLPLQKQKALQELATRLSSRKKHELSVSHCAESAATPTTRATTPITTKSHNSSDTSVHKPKISNTSLPSRVSTTTTTLEATDTHSRPSLNPYCSRIPPAPNNQPSVPQTIIYNTRKPVVKPIPNQLPADIPNSKYTIQNGPSGVKFTSATVNNAPSSSRHDALARNKYKSGQTGSEIEANTSTHAPGLVVLKKTCSEVAPKESFEPADVGCDPWEEEEDDEFGSQLLELADLVEKEQKMSQEMSDLANRRTKPISDRPTKPVVAAHTAPWKLVENKKRPGSATLGAGKQPSASTAMPLLPAKINIINHHHHSSALKGAPSGGGLKQSAIIYKSAVVSKAGLAGATCKANTVRSNTAVVRNAMGGAKPTDGDTACWPKTPSSNPPPPPQKLSYSDALLCKPPSIRFLPQKPPAPIPPRNHPLPSHRDLDLDVLFSGIDGNELDWDPDDQ